MKKCSILWNLISESIFEYETSKVVQIKSWKIGFVYRLIQLAIILYVSLWVMYNERGYQIFDYPVAGVTAKLKGIAFANLTNIPSIGMRVWDTADFVIPPQQNSAFFVATNMVITPNQSLGYCDESPDIKDIKCSNDNQCLKGNLIHTGSGVKTGKCVESTKHRGMKVCQIYGWCPTENDTMPIPNRSLLESAPNFTVLLKNSIEFPTFKIKRRNILKWMTRSYLKTCRYNPHDQKMKYCPIFRLGDIVKYSNAKYQNIWTLGGLMSIHIEWNCDLDFDIEYCVPEYTFRRLDDFKEEVGKGWNFRYSYHYVENGIEKRTLIKVYGIQFFITVSGRGGQFNPFKFSMNLGSGLALLGIASVLCDLFVLNIVRKRELYKKARVDSLKSVLNHRANDINDLGKNINSKSVKNRKQPRQKPEYQHWRRSLKISERNFGKYTTRLTGESSEKFQSQSFQDDNISLMEFRDRENMSRHKFIGDAGNRSCSYECLSAHTKRSSKKLSETEFTKLSKSTDVAWIDDCGMENL